MIEFIAGVVTTVVVQKKWRVMIEKIKEINTKGIRFTRIAKYTKNPNRYMVIRKLPLSAVAVWDFKDGMWRDYRLNAVKNYFESDFTESLDKCIDRLNNEFIFVD